MAGESQRPHDSANKPCRQSLSEEIIEIREMGRDGRKRERERMPEWILPRDRGQHDAWILTGRRKGRKGEGRRKRRMQG